MILRLIEQRAALRGIVIGNSQQKRTARVGLKGLALGGHFVKFIALVYGFMGEYLHAENPLRIPSLRMPEMLFQSIAPPRMKMRSDRLRDSRGPTPTNGDRTKCRTRYGSERLRCSIRREVVLYP